MQDWNDYMVHKLTHAKQSAGLRQYDRQGRVGLEVNHLSVLFGTYYQYIGYADNFPNPVINLYI